MLILLPGFRPDKEKLLSTCSQEREEMERAGVQFCRFFFTGRRTNGAVPFGACHLRFTFFFLQVCLLSREQSRSSHKAFSELSPQERKKERNLYFLTLICKVSKSIFLIFGTSRRARVRLLIFMYNMNVVVKGVYHFMVPLLSLCVGEKKTPSQC